jgi:hypothetical protein
MVRQAQKLREGVVGVSKEMDDAGVQKLETYRNYTFRFFTSASFISRMTVHLNFRAGTCFMFVGL